MPRTKHTETESLNVSRRNLLFGAAAGTLSTLAMPPAFAGGTQNACDGRSEDIVDLSRPLAFYGAAEQAGIRTPPQRHAFYMTFQLTTQRRRKLQVLLARWSAAIAQLMKGKTVGKVEPKRPNAVGFDTGEALNLGPASLTVTVGIGPRVFTATYGLAEKKPVLLRELKTLPGDAFESGFSGGDLSLQACADDPQVTYHAIRNLARIARQTGAATTHWAIMGFGRASAGKGQSTPRNLFGFKDGTRNVRSPGEFDRHVWINDGPAWQRHGTYQIVRKVRMNIETWDMDRIGDQENIFGRHKRSGAPLTGTHEFDTPNFDRKNPHGSPVIPLNAHIRLAAHENNDGIKILRRSFNYTGGLNNVGQLDAGLLFISYQNDPAHFEALQEKLGAADALNEYTTHMGSGIFFVPPAPPEGSYIGAQMFA